MEAKKTVEVVRLAGYDAAVAEAMRGLLVELSRSGRDKGPIAREWVDEVVASPWHDVLLAVEGEGADRRVLGMASVSVNFGAGIGKNEFLEDFVVSSESRGKGVGGLLWEAILAWGREKGCAKLEFTSGKGGEAAHQFYLKRGAEIYETNFFRLAL